MNRMRRLDAWLMVATFLVALAVRLIFAARLVFPPLDDPAFYLQTARNVAAGRGLVSDVIWNYFVPFTTVTHASHEFWMPLPTLLMAGAIKLFGDTLFIAQLPGLVCGALLVVLTFALGRYLWPAQRRWGLLAALFVVPVTIGVYQAGSADSAAVYALLSANALGLAAIVMDRARSSNAQSIKLALTALAVGVLCGLSYLARSHGSLVMAAIGLIWLAALRRDLKQLLVLIGALILGIVLIVGPWWLRNLTVFGSVQPFPLATAAAARDYGEWFNYLNLPSFSALLANGFAPALQLRWAALMHDVGVLALLTFPFGVIGLPVAVGQRHWLFRVSALYVVLLWIGVSGLFPVPALTGSFYHSAGSVMPVAALGAVAVVKALASRPRWRLWGLGVAVLLLALEVGQATIAWPTIWSDSQMNQAKFATVSQWLRSNVPSDQPIITNEAHSLNYASGYAALTLPNQQDVPIVRQLADRYGVRFVVVFGSIGRYPAAFERADRIMPRAQLGDVNVYEIQP